MESHDNVTFPDAFLKARVANPKPGRGKRIPEVAPVRQEESGSHWHVEIPGQPAVRSPRRRGTLEARGNQS
jgi:hypothetical protein